MAKPIIRTLLALFFFTAGLCHFVFDAAFARIVPPALPYPLAIVWATGVMEVAFAAALLQRRQLRWVGWVLCAYLLAVLPANIHMALTGMALGPFGASEAVLWGRAALQFPLIALVFWATSP
ncbi:MAG: hypothetical protein AAGH48_09885 [Pseudomonadota bacterium]